MGDIKIENADVASSHPLVLDVVDATSKEPTATHVLTFGDFVIVGALDNLVIVGAEEWAQRQADAAAEAKEAEAKAAQQASGQPAAQPLSAARVDYAEPAPTPGQASKLKRKELEEMTKEDLVAYADDRDIEVSSHWNKSDIIDAIVKG